MHRGRNNFIMFHRYHTDDQGGRAIQTGDFELWRYAAIADGEYEEEESGLKFPCFPQGREEGAYLSTRYPKCYYDQMMQNREVWNTQFQGRPTSKGGTFFDVTLIGTVPPAEFEALTMVHDTRAWDNAASEKSGDFTVGLRIAMDATGNFYLRNIKRAQVDTAGRLQLQDLAAREDGLMVPIHFPQDPASAGSDVAFFFKQEYQPRGFTVITERVTGSKTDRADEFSKAVNFSKFYIVVNPATPDEAIALAREKFDLLLHEFDAVWPVAGNGDDITKYNQG